MKMFHWIVYRILVHDAACKALLNFIKGHDKRLF
jgi:hypothetical protein